MEKNTILRYTYTVVKTHTCSEELRINEKIMDYPSSDVRKQFPLKYVLNQYIVVHNTILDTFHFIKRAPEENQYLTIYKETLIILGSCTIECKIQWYIQELFFQEPLPFFYFLPLLSIFLNESISDSYSVYKPQKGLS